MTERELLIEAITKYVEAGDKIGNYNVARRLLVQAKEELKEAYEEIQFLRKDADALREGRCLICEETDRVNNELRNIVVFKLQQALERIANLFDTGDMVQIAQDALEELKKWSKQPSY